MAGIELKIDDEYINGMASLFETRSQDLQEGVDSYLTILSTIKDTCNNFLAEIDEKDQYLF